MESKPLHILLVDDDPDECELFQAALTEVTVSSVLTVIHQCNPAMQWLNEHVNALPELMFLDLNMPLKAGQECLKEIKRDIRLNSLPVIILSLRVSQGVLHELYEAGALYFIQKPGSFQQQVQILERVLRLPEEERRHQPIKDEFILAY